MLIAPRPLQRYGSAVASIVLALLLRIGFHHYLAARVPFVFCLLATLFTVWYAGRGPALLALALGGLGTSYFILAPPGNLIHGIATHLLSLVSYTLIGLTSVLLIDFLRIAQRRAEASAREAQQKQIELEQEVERRRRVEEALIAADRQKDTFLAMLGHELRTPLAAIYNTLPLIQRRTADDVDVARMGERVERQVNRMARLIDDLQDVSRLALGKLHLHRERLDLVRLLQETAEDQRAALEAQQLTLALDLPDAPVFVQGDRMRLPQVVVNLLDNAAKFTDPEGRVSLCLRPDAGMAAVMVSDTGIGIEPALLPHLFESFTQAEQSLIRSKGGLGLGLSLAKGLVELHGGCIEAASDGPGKGAVFTFRLPLVAGEMLTPAAGEDPAAVIAGEAETAKRVRGAKCQIGEGEAPAEPAGHRSLPKAARREPRPPRTGM